MEECLKDIDITPSALTFPSPPLPFLHFEFNLPPCRQRLLADIHVLPISFSPFFLIVTLQYPFSSETKKVMLFANILSFFLSFWLMFIELFLEQVGV